MAHECVSDGLAVGEPKPVATLITLEFVQTGVADCTVICGSDDGSTTFDCGATVLAADTTGSPNVPRPSVALTTTPINRVATPDTRRVTS